MSKSKQQWQVLRQKRGLLKNCVNKDNQHLGANLIHSWQRRQLFDSVLSTEVCVLSMPSLNFCFHVLLACLI